MNHAMRFACVVLCVYGISSAVHGEHVRSGFARNVVRAGLRRLRGNHETGPEATGPARFAALVPGAAAPFSVVFTDHTYYPQDPNGHYLHDGLLGAYNEQFPRVDGPGEVTQPQYVAGHMIPVFVCSGLDLASREASFYFGTIREAAIHPPTQPRLIILGYGPAAQGQRSGYDASTGETLASCLQYVHEVVKKPVVVIDPRDSHEVLADLEHEAPDYLHLRWGRLDREVANFYVLQPNEIAAFIDEFKKMYSYVESVTPGRPVKSTKSKK